MERCIGSATSKLNAELVLKASAPVKWFLRDTVINRTETGQLLLHQSEVPKAGGLVSTHERRRHTEDIASKSFLANPNSQNMSENSAQLRNQPFVHSSSDYGKSYFSLWGCPFKLKTRSIKRCIKSTWTAFYWFYRGTAQSRRHGWLQRLRLLWTFMELHATLPASTKHWKTRCYSSQRLRWYYKANFTWCDCTNKFRTYQWMFCPFWVRSQLVWVREVKTNLLKLQISRFISSGIIDLQ